jgi:hypothetical protein
MSPFLFLFLRLFLFKSALGLHLTFFPADLPARRRLRWQRTAPSFFDPVVQKSHLPIRMEPVLSFFHHC